MTEQEKDKYIKVLETLLDERGKVLALIPECPIHGDKCMPHCADWITKHLPLPKPPTQTDEELLATVIGHHNFKPSYMCSVGSMQTTDLTELIKEILKHFKRKDAK